MANFIEIKYFARGNGEDSFYVYEKFLKKPHSCYINLDNIERISQIIHNDNLIVKLDNDSTTSITQDYFLIYTISNKYFVLKEEEFSKFIKPGNSI